MAKSYQASGVIKCTAAGDAETGLVVINKIRWTGATTAGHVLLISDSSGKEILHSVASGANNVEDIDFKHGLTVHGITITTLGSGTVYIYG